MEPTKPKIKEYADGWITEQAGTEVPGFLKLAFIVIAGGALMGLSLALQILISLWEMWIDPLKHGFGLVRTGPVS